MWQNTILRYSAARPGRNQIVLLVVLVLVLDQFNSIYEDDDEDEDEKIRAHGMISTDTDRLQICVTLNTASHA